MGRRIEQKFDGELRPVHAGPPLLASSATSWAGFLLERDWCRAGNARTIVYPHTSLVLTESGAIEVEDRALAQNSAFLARCGTVTVWPADHESRSTVWRPAPSSAGVAEMLRVDLDLTLLQRLAPDEKYLVRRPLAPQGAAEDAQSASMMRIMAQEIAAGCPGGRLFAEALCLALAAHIARCYASAVPQSLRRPAGGLSRRQLDAVCDRIEADLGGDLSLVQLAALAGLSPHHFATAFRRSVGTSPHQYVLRRRLDKARDLLVRQGLPVAEVALMLGFASQSHFTEAFRRFVGTTPKRFQTDH